MDVASLADPALVDVDDSLLEQHQLDEAASILLALDECVGGVGHRMELLGLDEAQLQLLLQYLSYKLLAY